MFPAGDAIIDHQFFVHVLQTLENAGVANSTHVAQEMVFEKLPTIKKTFTGKEVDSWVAIQLGAIRVANLQPTSSKESKRTRIEETG
jgi:hypothetical protein